jgi:hypothetical protein
MPNFPAWWLELPDYKRREVEIYLKSPNRVNGGFHEWERGRQTWRQLARPGRQHERNLIVMNLRANGYPDAGDNAADSGKYMLYDKPNGGNRILPSVYTALTDHWLRATHMLQPIDTMNDGHIESTLALLRESHGNLIDRCTSLLGKMHHHFRNDSSIQILLEDLCLLMQKMDVDDVYPIFKLLADELHGRRPETGFNVQDALNIDDNLSKW